MNKFFALLFTLLILTSIRITAQNENESGNPQVNSFFENALTTYNLAAISAGIIKDNKLSWSNAYGCADFDTGRKPTSSTLFPQGSVSKTITAAAVLKLWEDGKIKLNDDVNNYLPFSIRNPKFLDVPITVRMLLTHLSSMSDRTQTGNRLSFLYGFEDNTTDLEKLIREFVTPGGEYYNEHNFTDDAPGTKYEYCNIAFSVLGLIVERLSGQTFEDYCRTNIFNLLKMDETTFLLSKTNLDNFAYNYGYEDGDTTLTKYPPFTWPGYMDGSLRTSVNEYSNFMLMLLNHGRFEGKQFFKEETVAEFLKPQNVPGMPPGRLAPNVDLSITWSMMQLGDDIVYAHNGFGSGFFSMVYFCPDKKYGGMLSFTGQMKSFQDLGMMLKGALQVMIGSSK